MGGRITNILVGLVNIFLGLILLLFQYINVEKALEFSKYQNEIIGYIQIAIYGAIGVTILINIIYAIINKEESRLKTGYLLMIPTIIFIFFSQYYTAIFPIISGITVLIGIKNKNFIEAENYNSIILSILQTLAYFAIIFVIIMNPYIADRLRVRDNIGLVKFSEEDFKRIEPVDIEDVFINIKNQDDKFGYIDATGNIMLPYEYDYATPFYNIDKFEKRYQVAGVTKDDITSIVLKNGRTIMSYKSEYEIFDYISRLKEFEKMVKEKIKPDDIEMELKKPTNAFIKKKRYKENNISGTSSIQRDISSMNAGDSERTDIAETTNVSGKDWTHRFDYTDKYDILVMESKMGLPSTYYLADKNDLSKRRKLEVEYLVYDNEFLYVYEGDLVPFFNPSEKMHGYFEPDGNRRKIEGMAQLIDAEKNRVLIKNYALNSTYFIDMTGKRVSPMFKDVIVDKLNNRFIVKQSNDKWTVLNKDLQRVFEEEFDIAKVDLLNIGLYMFANMPEELQFNQYKYVKIDYMVVNSEGQMVANEVNFIYDIYDQYPKKEITPEEYNLFVESLKNVNINYAGDKYFENIINPENT